MIETVNGSGLPAKIGPYSHAVRAAGFLFVSGQAGVDPVSGQPAGPTMTEQAAQAFANLATVLDAGGSEPGLVVSTTVLVADMSQFTEVNRQFAEFFGAGPPARMTMQVVLPLGLLISIGCTALLRDLTGPGRAGFTMDGGVSR
jgi:2-iminobutanoate/2-iminopropanoate deaminase